MSVIDNVLFSDWLIYNLIDHATPVDFFHFKYVSKFFYNNITHNDIEKIIVLNIHKNLKYRLGTFYTEFIQNISTKKMTIAGNFIIQCILNTVNYDSIINVYSYEYQHTNICDILPSLKNIVGDIPIHFKSMNYNYMLLENVKKFVITDYYKLDISKNIFSIINGKSTLSICNLNKIMNKFELLKGNKIRNNNFYCIEKICYPISLNEINMYKNNGFNFKYELNFANCFEYDSYLYHFLVYTNDKFTFLSKIFDTNMLFRNKIAISHSNYLEFTLNAEKKITNKIFSDNKIKTIQCSCKLYEYFMVKHNHTECKITSINRNKDINLILINIDDLNGNLLCKYNNLFSGGYSDNFLKMNHLYDSKIKIKYLC